MMCLNGEGECPDRYKQSVVRGFLYRAKTIGSERSELLIEISRCKQILINNGYSNRQVDNEISTFMKKNIPPVTTPTATTAETSITNTATTTAATTTTTTTTTATTTTNPSPTDPSPTTSPGTTHKVFYQNFMNPKYKHDEQNLKRIIKDHVNVRDKSDNLKLIIYYRSRKTRDLIMKNNLTPKLRDLARTNLIYQFRCTIDECAHRNKSEVSYTGLTTCTLSKRLSGHLQKGAILEHSLQTHQRKPTRKEIVEMTKARYYQSNYRRLETLEALIILQEDPVINRQDTGKLKTLKLFGTGQRTFNVSNSNG